MRRGKRPPEEKSRREKKNGRIFQIYFPAGRRMLRSVGIQAQAAFLFPQVFRFTRKGAKNTFVKKNKYVMIENVQDILIALEK